MVSRKKPFKLCLAIVLLIPLLLMFGCNIGGKTKQKDVNVYHTGTQGVFLSFEPNYPTSSEIPSTSPSSLTVAVRVNNKGAYTIPGGGLTLVLGGYDPNIISFSEGNIQQTRDDLEGKSEIYSGGGYDILQWEANSIDDQFMGDEYRPELKVTACYEYATEATPQVCIDPDPYSSVETSKICKPGTLSASVSGGQGAPVAVTSVQEKILPKEEAVLFTIQLANVGGGTVVDLGSLGACEDKTLQLSDLDVIDFDEAMIGSNTILDCKPSIGRIKLMNNKATIYCKADSYLTDTSIGAYKTKLFLKFSYGYTTSISKPIKIVNTQFEWK